MENVRQLELIITAGGDGIAYDQADWAEAKLIEADGQDLQLSDVVRKASPFLSQMKLPASFRYAGQSSETLLNTWARAEKPPAEKDGRRIYETTWQEPGGLAATWHAEVFADRPAVEFRWIFENRGRQPSKPLSDVCALDLLAASGQARLIHSSGGLTGPADGGPVGFAVSESDTLRPGSDPAKGISLSAAGGRSSNKDLRSSSSTTRPRRAAFSWASVGRDNGRPIFAPTRPRQAADHRRHARHAYRPAGR